MSARDAQDRHALFGVRLCFLAGQDGREVPPVHMDLVLPVSVIDEQHENHVRIIVEG